MLISPDKVMKIIIAGDGGVGKTTLIKRLSENQPFQASQDQALTVGCDFFIKKVQINGYTKYLQIWDLGGQDQFRFFQEDFFKGASGAIIAFDVQRIKSFFDLNDWVKTLRQSDINLPILLAIMKSDLQYHPSLNLDLIKEFVSKNQILDFIEVSSKEGLNIETVFKKLLQKIGNCDKAKKTCESTGIESISFI